MPHEQQLQLQRDLINKADSEYTRMYGSMSETTKLLFWYRLAQGDGCYYHSYAFRL